MKKPLGAPNHLNAGRSGLDDPIEFDDFGYLIFREQAEMIWHELPKFCTVCGKPKYAKGLCQRHYDMQLKEIKRGT